MTDYADVLEWELARLQPRRVPFEDLRRRRDRRQRSRQIRAGILAIVMALGAIGLLLKAFSGAQRVPAGLPDTPGAWAQHDVPGQLTGDWGGIYSVIQGGPGLVAVGESDGRRHAGGYILDGPATVWTSPDGRTWTRLLGCTSAEPPCNSRGDPSTVEVGDQLGLGRMLDVTEGGPGLVAVGASGRSPNGGHTGRPGYTDSVDAVVWTSTDGSTWTRLPNDATFGDAEMQAVASGPAGLVAVGVSHYHPGGDTANGQPTAWFSSDGTAWSRIPLEGRPGELLTDVTTFGDGFVVVAAHSPYRPSNGVIWTSKDGLSWTRVAEGPVTRGIDLEGVTDGPDGLVAVGFVGGLPRRTPVVLRSTDGEHWRRVDPSESALVFPSSLQRGFTEMSSVAATSAGYVAVGSDIGCPAVTPRTECGSGGTVWTSGFVVWTSPDGHTWTRVDGFPNTGVAAVTPWGSRFVAVGGPSFGVQDFRNSGTAWVSR